MSTLVRSTKTFAALVAATTVLAACSSSEPTSEPTTEPTSSATPSITPTPTPSDTATAEEEPTPAAPELLVRIDGPNVQPNAQEIELETGEKLMIEIQSDRAGELHVHSTPEQYVEFDAGTGPVTLGLLKRRALAKDAGVPAEGSGSHRLTIVGDPGAITDPDGFVWETASGD